MLVEARLPELAPDVILQHFAAVPGRREHALWRRVPAQGVSGLAFAMGSPSEEEGHAADESLVPVRLGAPFLVMASAVSFGQWRRFADNAAHAARWGEDPLFPVTHVDWFLGPDWSRTDESRVSDLARFPELRLLNRPSLQLLPALASLVILWLIGGAWLARWGGVVATGLLWHGTFTINSLSHMFGSRKYATSDDSRNNWLLALITMGEGWHNNHHHYQSSCNQGFHWWQIDVTYYILKGFEKVGLIWDVRRAPAHVIEGRPGGDIDGDAEGTDKAALVKAA